MKKCSKCGSENADDAVFCAQCCATEFAACDEADSLSEKPKEAETLDNGGKLCRIVAACKKANGNRNLLINGSVAIIAIVLTLVILLAPIRVSLAPLDYYTISDMDQTGFEDQWTSYYTVDSDGKVIHRYGVRIARGVDNSSVYIDQSIFDFIGALTYTFLDSDEDAEKISKITKEYENAYEQINKELAEWIAGKTADESDAEYMREMTERKEELAQKYLSDINILEYMLANYRTETDKINDKIEETYDKLKGIHDDTQKAVLEAQIIQLHTERNYLDSIYINEAVTVFSGFVIFLASATTAIISLIFLALAIIDICLKKSNRPPQERLFRLFKAVLIPLCTVGVLTAITPLTKAGGGVIAATLIWALSFMLCGICKVFAVGTGSLRDKAVYVAKNSAIAIAALTVLLMMLSTDTFTITYRNNGVTDSTKFPIGFLTFYAFSSFFYNGDCGFSFGYNDGTAGTTTIIMFLTAFMLAAVTSIMYAALEKQANVATIPQTKILKSLSPEMRNTILWLVFFTVTVTLCFLSGIIFDLNLSETEKAFSDVVKKEVDIVTYFRACAQLWVSLGLIIAIVVAEKVVKIPALYTEEPILQKRNLRLKI